MNGRKSGCRTQPARRGIMTKIEVEREDLQRLFSNYASRFIDDLSLDKHYPKWIIEFERKYLKEAGDND